jgi:hypothetical protein
MIVLGGALQQGAMISFDAMKTQANSIIRREEMKEVLIYLCWMMGNKIIINIIDCHKKSKAKRNTTIQQQLE